MFEKIIDPRLMPEKYSRELSRFPAFCFSNFPRAFFFLFSSIYPLTASLQVTRNIASSNRGEAITPRRVHTVTAGNDYCFQQTAETRLTIQVLLVQALLEE